MKRQSDLDAHNPDLWRDRMQDRLLWGLCIIVLMLTAAFIYRSWQVGELMRMI